MVGMCEHFNVIGLLFSILRLFAVFIRDKANGDVYQFITKYRIFLLLNMLSAFWEKSSKTKPENFWLKFED